MKKRILFIIIFLLVLFSIFLIIFYKFNKIPPYIKQIDILSINEKEKKFDISIITSTNGIFKNDSYYYITNNKKINEGSQSEFMKCEHNICVVNDIDFQTENYIFLKDKKGSISKPYTLSENIENKVFDINTEYDVIYLLVNDTKKIKYSFSSLFMVNYDDIFIYSENDEVASIENGFIKANKVGTTNIIINIKGMSKKIMVVVTNLITKPKINNNKPFLECKKYSAEDAKILDELLNYRINEVGGMKTRSAVVAAARFLLLEFPYRINYFAENGRLSTHNINKYADGEGRYYHIGLYLNENKFSSILKSATGPAIWGCPLKMKYGEVDQPSGKYYENGLDCSGFVSWALLNGGYDVGDIGAGFSNESAISNLGKRESITLDNINKAKAGDIIGIDGHAAIIIGIDRINKKVYIAETLYYNVGTNVLTFSFNQLIYTRYFTYIIHMDHLYQKDGIYTDMW